MKLVFVLSIFLVSFISYAKVNCLVESPCSWLNPVPGNEDNASLGYCVVSVSGDENTLTIERTDGDGNKLTPFKMKVQKFAQDKIYARSKVAILAVTSYADFLAGTLEMIQPKLGFFISCKIIP